MADFYYIKSNMFFNVMITDIQLYKALNDNKPIILVNRGSDRDSIVIRATSSYPIPSPIK